MGHFPIEWVKILSGRRIIAERKGKTSIEKDEETWHD
jgi:hypothetical protein